MLRKITAIQQILYEVRLYFWRRVVMANYMCKYGTLNVAFKTTLERHKSHLSSAIKNKLETKFRGTY